MSKKYRTSSYGLDVVLHTENVPDPVRPVVYSGKDLDGLWYADHTYPIGNSMCAIEEVPEEPIGVGHSWTDSDGWLWRVAAEHPDGGKFLLIYCNPDDGFWNVEESYEGAGSDPNPWYAEEDIRLRQESGK